MNGYFEKRKNRLRTYKKEVDLFNGEKEKVLF
jgi:hypothetical protein